MKLAIVYNKNDHKLQENSYSYIYKGMFNALISRFEEVQKVTSNCSAQDIEADVILFYDVHSSHHIKIDGVQSHSALKMEYMSDPHQHEVRGMYKQYNIPVHKLGIGQRLVRAFFDRGVEFIISPVREGYFKYFSPILGEEIAEKALVYFPLAPSFEPCEIPISVREWKVLGNGATWDGGIGAYDFRRWAFQQEYIHIIDHCITNTLTPYGKDYGKFISRFAGALALSEFYPVNKYYEMPFAGCLTFAQYHKEYEDLGFRDYETCIYVNKDNFEQRVKDFLYCGDETEYAKIASFGQSLMEQKYTAKHFADFIYKFVENKKRGENAIQYAGNC